MMNMSVTILAIESSCDDTSAAVICDGEVLSNCVANQEAHKLYGGVVPEVASRAHQINIIPVVDMAIKNIKEMAGLENHLYVHPLKELLSKEERFAVVRSLFLIASPVWLS